MLQKWNPVQLVSEASCERFLILYVTRDLTVTGPLYRTRAMIAAKALSKTQTRAIEHSRGFKKTHELFAITLTSKNEIFFLLFINLICNFLINF